MKEPALLIPDTVTYSKESGNGNEFLTYVYSNFRASMVLQHLPEAPAHERLSIRLIFEE